MHEFIEWHQLTDVTLVGHAIGGQVALMYTHLYPQNVNKLVLVSSAGMMEKSPFLDYASMPESHEYIQDKVGEAFYMKESISEKLVEEIYTTVQNIPKRLTIGTLARSSRHTPVSAFLKKIDHLVLLIWGLYDKLSPPEVAMHFHDLLPNADVKFIDHCGHLPMIEKDEVFNNILLPF